MHRQPPLAFCGNAEHFQRCSESSFSALDRLCPVSAIPSVLFQCQDLSVANRHHSAADTFEKCVIMTDDQLGDLQRLDCLGETIDRCGVERRSRLIQKNHFGFHRKDAGDGDQPLLPAGGRKRCPRQDLLFQASTAHPMHECALERMRDRDSAART